MATHALPAFFEERAISETGLAERLKGSVGLNMNYSIIFTEISFYPETSILLQIIQIIHYSYDNLVYATIRQRRVDSLPILAPSQLAGRDL